MKKQVLSILIMPVLVTMVALGCFLTLENGWEPEMSTVMLFLLTLLYIKVFEHVIPFRKTWSSDRKDLATDLKHLFLSAFLFDFVGKAMAISLIFHFQEYFFATATLWGGFPFIVSYLAANVIGELLPYLYHRWSHIGNKHSPLSMFLWKIHSVHHLPKVLNWFKTNWIHPVNMLLNTFLKVLPLLILGFSKEVIFCVNVTHVVIAYFSHANIETRTAWLNYFFVTPKLHQFHHSTRLDEAKNFGNIIPFWDILFGTFYDPARTVKDVGIADGDKDVYPSVHNYWEQIVFPFYKKKKRHIAEQHATNLYDEQERPE